MILDNPQYPTRFMKYNIHNIDDVHGWPNEGLVGGNDMENDSLQWQHQGRCFW